jgi:hypothetical protein
MSTTTKNSADDQPVVLFIASFVSALAGSFALPLGGALWLRCEFSRCSGCQNCVWLLVEFTVYSAVQFLSVGLFGARLGRVKPVDRVALAGWSGLLLSTTMVLWLLVRAST